jgi:hypothetical protein
MSNQRAAMQRRNGNQFSQPQYAPAPPIQKVRTAQFSQPVPQVQQRGQPQEQLQAPQPGVIMTVNEAITRITKRLVHVEDKLADIENSGLSSSSSASANSTSVLADDTAINDILERINAIEDWIDSNNFEGYTKQLQSIQSEFNKHTRLQNDRILKLETEIKKKQQLAHPPPPLIEQHQEVLASTTVPRPRRFGGNKNVIPTYNPTVLDLNIDGQLISDLDTTTENNDSVE